MAGKNTAAFGIYRDRAGVEAAVDMLREKGFRNTDISVLFPHNDGTKDFATEKNTKAPEGTAAGAGTGAVVGGALGWLAGIGALAIPGRGTVHRGRSDHGSSGRRWRRRGRWRPDRSPDRHGHPGVRGQALRRPDQGRRNPAFGALRRLRLDQESQGDPRKYGRAGCHVHRRGQGGLSEDR